MTIACMFFLASILIVTAVDYYDIFFEYTDNKEVIMHYIEGFEMKSVTLFRF